MIYLDSGILIRLLEGLDSVRVDIETALEEAQQAGISFSTSDLSQLECCCKPMRENQDELLSLYRDMFSSGTVFTQRIAPSIIQMATEIRAFQGLRSADAIHAATAILSGSSELWTTDQDFQRCKEISVRMFRAV